MRRILRAAGRTARVFLWIVKGLLLVLAVGAAVLWPVSRGRHTGVSAERYTARPASGEGRRYAAACWDELIALAAGAWSIASIILLIRQRRKRRRLARVGCCQQCGYDLRATAAAGGPLLARCPECGAESAAVSLKNL